MTLAEVESAVAALPIEEQEKLLRSLESRIRPNLVKPPTRHSVLDIPAVSIGTILEPLSRIDDDLLDEMLEGRV